MDLLEPIKQVLVDMGDVDPALIRDEAELTELGIDSLAAAEMIVELEMRLDCQFPVEVLRNLSEVTTLADVARHLESSLPTALPSA